MDVAITTIINLKKCETDKGDKKKISKSLEIVIQNRLCSCPRSAPCQSGASHSHIMGPINHNFLDAKKHLIVSIVGLLKKDWRGEHQFISSYSSIVTSSQNVNTMGKLNMDPVSNNYNEIRQ